MVYKFSIKEAIYFGYEKFKANFKFFINIQLFVFFVIYLLPSFVREVLIAILKYIINNYWQYYLGQSLSVFFFLILLSFILFIILLQYVVSLGFIKISLNFFDEKESRLIDLFKHWDLLLRYIAGNVLYFLIVLLGLILLIVPGIIFAIKYQFYPYLIVDKKLGIIDSLKTSAFITKGVKWHLFLFGLVIILINIIGFLCLIVGLFVTIPITILAYAFVYRKLYSGGGK